MQLNDGDFSQLDSLSQVESVKMLERDFVKRLLPHLIPDESGQPKDVSIYVAATGNPYRMIDVLDDNTRKILFTVPPLMSSTPMTIRDLNSTRETDIGELAAQFQAEVTSNHPGFVVENFVNRMVSLNKTPNEVLETIYALMWAGIHERYNIPLELRFGERTEEIKTLMKGKATDSSDKEKPTLLGDIDDEDFEDL